MFKVGDKVLVKPMKLKAVVERLTGIDEFEIKHLDGTKEIVREARLNFDK